MSAIQTIRITTGTSATYISTATIPGGAIVHRCTLDTQSTGAVAYSGGTTLAIGQSGSTSLLMATTDNDPTRQNLYDKPQQTPWGANAAAVLVTIGGSPGAGAGFVIVEFSNPAT